MKQQEKQLLLKDLCARLPYGVKVSITAHNLDYEKDFGKTIIADLTGIHTSKDDEGTIHTCLITCYDKFKTQGNDIDTIKPYLRPMSSMTEEEEKVFNDFLEFQAEYVSDADLDNKTDMYDWLNAHHFDYRIDPSTGKTLIESNLAIEAPKDMYKNE